MQMSEEWANDTESWRVRKELNELHSKIELISKFLDIRLEQIPAVPEHYELIKIMNK